MLPLGGIPQRFAVRFLGVSGAKGYLMNTSQQLLAVLNFGDNCLRRDYSDWATAAGVVEGTSLSPEQYVRSMALFTPIRQSVFETMDLFFDASNEHGRCSDGEAYASAHMLDDVWELLINLQAPSWNTLEEVLPHANAALVWYNTVNRSVVAHSDDIPF